MASKSQVGKWLKRQVNIGGCFRLFWGGSDGGVEVCFGAVLGAGGGSKEHNVLLNADWFAWPACESVSNQDEGNSLAVLCCTLVLPCAGGDA